jgi:hypothetical protein
MSIPPSLAASMDFQNLAGPFVTSAFAENLARVVFQERYSKDVFVARTPATVVDKWQVWWVSMNNALPLDPKSIRPFRLIVGN